MDIRTIVQGSTLCLSADRHAIFHLCHHWNAGMLSTFILYIPTFFLQEKISKLIVQLGSSKKSH